MLGDKQCTTKVNSVMKPNPKAISPDSTLMDAAQRMAELECGILPVGANEQKPEGVITDRDIVIRAVAKGKDISQEKVRDYMTGMVHSIRHDETLDKAADKMREHHVSRLLVEEEDGKICGIITFGNMLRKDEDFEERAQVVDHAVGKKAA